MIDLSTMIIGNYTLEKWYQGLESKDTHTNNNIASKGTKQYDQRPLYVGNMHTKRDRYRYIVHCTIKVF